MTVTAALSALLGAHLSERRKVHPLDPYKRTLELVRSQEVKAAAELQDAIRELVRTVNEKEDDQ